MEEGKLVLVDQGRGRERSGQEMKGWSRSTEVEALESLQGQPPVYCQNFHISLGEKERCQATKQFGGRVAGLHPQACCWVSPVIPSHPT